MPIPLFKPVHTDEMEKAALDVIRSGQIASGPGVEKFERAFGSYIGRNHVVATSDMTSAIVIALRLAGIKSGDRVATLAFACLSTNAAIRMVGAVPVWVDLDTDTMSMCSKDLARKLTTDTKAVLLYYVAGYPASVEEITFICQRHGIPLIEDCNNALGALFKGQPIGRHGHYAVYSFYPNRQINGFEGGALVCPNENLAQHAKRLRRFGVDYTSFRDARGEINPEADVPEIGLSASFCQLNAAVANSQLSTLSERLCLVRENANKLTELLKDKKGIKVVQTDLSCVSAHWCFLVFADKRDRLLSVLKEQSISCSILHHRNDEYSGMSVNKAVLPGTDYTMKHLLALPCGWWLSQEEICRIGAVVIKEIESW